MLIEPDRLDEIFKHLRTAQESSKPIYIFASLDCDSICATKILTSICTQSSLRYILRPVRGWQDLNTKINLEVRKMIGEGELDNLIFINCLGTEDAMRTVFGVDIDETDFPDFHIFIFDFHKPVHLSNVHSSEMIWVVDTTDACHAKYPSIYIEEDDDESEEFSASDDDDDEMMGGQPPTKKRKLNLNPDKYLEKQKLKRKCEEYYAYSNYRLSSSFFMYQLGAKINKDDNTMLWCGIVGTSKLFLNQEMSCDVYNDMMEELQGQVLRRNNPYVEPEMQDTESAPERRKPNHIQFSNELRLVMLHHWTIYNSMFYSPIVAAKLGLWKEHGRATIDFLLAKMSLPQKEAHQEWDSIEGKLQKEFFGKFEKHALENFGDDIMYASFTKQHGDFDNLRAADMVYAITALLEDEKLSQESEANNETESYAFVEKNFKISMDSIDIKNQKQLKYGIKLAKHLQKSVADKALDILNKTRITSCGIFRYVFIDEKNEFYTPISISKLALFVQNSYTERLKDKNKRSSGIAKPLVCACWNDYRNTFTVCGVPSTKNRKHLDKNPFGRAFKLAAKAINARVSNITFETYLMEIQKDDWKDFVDELHSVLVDSC